MLLGSVENYIVNSSIRDNPQGQGAIREHCPSNYFCAYGSAVLTHLSISPKTTIREPKEC